MADATASTSLPRPVRTRRAPARARSAAYCRPSPRLAPTTTMADPS